MGALSIWHWLIILAIVVVIFGTKKLTNIGSDLGGAVKSFKNAMREEEPQQRVEDHSHAGQPATHVDAHEKSHQ